MQRAQKMNSEMSLREQLLAETANNAPAPYPSSAGASQGPSNPYPPSDHSGSPHEHHPLDPNVAGGQMQYSMSGDHQMSGGEGAGKGKRELSTSKRAAQNRAAQRAFRQRKEGYIKKLEEQVKDFQSMEYNFKALQNENYQLREYILTLQSKLLENQADFPPAPTHANLSASAPQQYPSRAEASYASDQQARHEHEQRPPPPAPVAASEDQRHDGIAALHQAAVAQEARPQSSPYGLASEYPSRQPETAGGMTPFFSWHAGPYDNLRAEQWRDVAGQREFSFEFPPRRMTGNCKLYYLRAPWKRDFHARNLSRTPVPKRLLPVRLNQKKPTLLSRLNATQHSPISAPASMAMSSALWAGAQSVREGAQLAFTKASRALSAARFNRESFDEARGYDFEEGVEYDSENDSGDEDWIDVKKEKRDLSMPQEEFMVKSVSGQARQLRLKISKTATEKASAAAGVSFEYAKWALHLVAVEAAHDLGFLASCRTATDVVRAVKARFPVLEDIQKAYRSGSLEASSSDSSTHLNRLARTYSPQPGIKHPRDVRMASNLDDMPIIAETTTSESSYAPDGAPLYDPKTGAELEIVYEEASRGRRRLRSPGPYDCLTEKGRAYGRNFAAEGRRNGQDDG
ncbi:hypothetical protein BST61_g2102 [Cercospora zeina]